MYRSNQVNAAIVILFCILIIHIVRIILHVKVYFVYSMGLGPLFLIGLIIFLIIFLFLKG
ncbi:hypothetical protein LCM10_03310 [Rossellomorea aquimaris]|uniref:hypothetical protein n=1 Tax=Rossellomorea aquimaris TaxID=189382 RepID=UPI001CD4680F|nr:hypothetical protein [Rossellomorea aquimaris]MCA1054004.1 hypothetical protein [Rossellomorea aquimaris]